MASAYCKKLAESMDKRLKAVRDANGDHTKCSQARGPSMESAGFAASNAGSR